MEIGFAHSPEASNPFQQRSPQPGAPGHPTVPSQQGVPSSETQPRGRALRPDMPVYAGPRIRRPVTPENATPPPPPAGAPFGLPPNMPRSPLEHGHAGSNGVPAGQAAAQGYASREMETLRAPGAFVDRTPSSDARGRSQDRRQPSLPRVSDDIMHHNTCYRCPSFWPGFLPLQCIRSTQGHPDLRHVRQS